MPDKVERCNTPEFDEQYACYPAQHPQGLMQDDCFAQPTPMLYSCVPVHVAVPAPATEEMRRDWTGYAPTATYMHDWSGQYQPEARPYAPQQYVLVQMQPQSQWTQNAPQQNAVRMDNDGFDRSRESR
jgi:hypothetical protein